MRYSNRYKLPGAFVRAVENDPYDKGNSDFSATGLAEPPRATVLKAQHPNDLIVDVSSRVASIIGQGAHHIAERAARPGIDLCEKRFFADFNVDGVKYIVSAQIDLFETDTCALYDWKTAKAYAFSKGVGGGKKPEWIQQMNVGAEIMRRHGHDVKSLGVIAMLKDFRSEEAGQKGMPETEVISVDIPLWEPAKANDYIETRIRLHIAARKELPLCSASDNWSGRKCSKWCDANSVCEQFQNSKKTGLLNE